MIRRRIVFIYWICAILLLPRAAYAYIDPATTTYLIQIATAVVVMAGVSLSVFLYRFRTISAKIKYWIYGVIYRTKQKDDKISIESFNNDQQQKEIVTIDYVKPGLAIPPDISSFNEKIRDELLASKEITVGKEQSVSTPVHYLARSKMTSPIAIALCFTFIIVGCLELATKYSPEIPFKITSIIPVVIIVFVVLTLVLAFGIPLFRGKVFELLLVVGMAILVAGYIQGNFLNVGIGELTGDAVIWQNLVPQLISSIICWVGCFVLLSIVSIRARKIWRKIIVFVPILLILLQSVSMASVLHDKSNDGVWGQGVYWQSADETLTINGINEVASKRNAIIIVLDRLDQEFVEEIHVEDPHFFDVLDGFTEFDDFITNFGSTFPSVAGFLTGHKYEYDIPHAAYYDYAWANATFLQALKEKGVDIRLYMDRGFGFNNTEQLGGLASNTVVGEIEINKRIALVKLLKLSGYRYAPLPLKQIFWLSATEFIDTLELTSETAPYMVNDFAFYERLMTEGLRVSDKEYSFKYIHMLGPHPPFNMDENINYVEESDFISQAKGSFKIVFEYLRQLKRLGLYDDSTIIIMGDHGNYLGDELTRPARAGLFVKPAGSANDPLQISHAPVSPAQIHPTIMEGFFGDTKGFGETFFDVKEGDDVIRFYTINLSRYEIRGDGRDFANWRFIGHFPSTYR